MQLVLAFKTLMQKKKKYITKHKLTAYHSPVVLRCSCCVDLSVETERVNVALRPLPLLEYTVTKYPAPGSSPVTTNSGFERLVMLDTIRRCPLVPPLRAAEQSSIVNSWGSPPSNPFSQFTCTAVDVRFTAKHVRGASGFPVQKRQAHQFPTDNVRVSPA